MSKVLVNKSGQILVELTGNGTQLWHLPISCECTLFSQLYNYLLLLLTVRWISLRFGEDVHGQIQMCNKTFWDKCFLLLIRSPPAPTLISLFSQLIVLFVCQNWNKQIFLFFPSQIYIHMDLRTQWQSVHHHSHAPGRLALFTHW